MSIFQLRNVGLCHGENQGTHPETDIIRALYNLWCSDRGSLRTAYGCPAHRATPGSEAFSSRGRGNEAQQNDKQPVSPRRFFAQTDYPAPETLELYRKRTGATGSVCLDLRSSPSIHHVFPKRTSGASLRLFPGTTHGLRVIRQESIPNEEITPYKRTGSTYFRQRRFHAQKKRPDPI